MCETFLDGIDDGDENCEVNEEVGCQDNVNVNVNVNVIINDHDLDSQK